MEEPPRLVGQSVRDIRWALERTLGPEVVERALASLPEPIRSEYAEASPLEWVPYATVVSAHEAIAREGNTTMEAMLELAVPLAVERAFKTVWRILLRFTSDDSLISRTPLLYSKTRSKGRMTARRISPGLAVAEIEGWSGMPPRDVRAIALSIETTLRLCGRENVTCSAEPTANGARYEIRWLVND
jgi:hypothetical protein